jgi:dephospho-CoA kinase
VPKRIGITGGIGAGKSIVSKIIESMGFPVFNSDDEAKKIINSHPAVKAELIALFGNSIYSNDELNRPKLAKLIFNDPSLREKVNEIIHPRVRLEFDRFVSGSSSQLIFNEAAILFETGAYKQFDDTVLITSPIELRIERLIARDNSSREEIEARMKAQWSDDQKQQLADYVIINDEVNPLLSQIEKVISDLLN